jgi:predicted AAA+ superfamily ATPase
MIPRHLAKHIKKYAKQYPIVALVGPRQSGKTTLSRFLFPKYRYVSLENLDLRHQASTDPRGFLLTFGPYVILDEVQRVPELLPYIQELVDTNQEPAQYILTGSSQFLLMESVTQSLAGRVVFFKLYPLSYLELNLLPPDRSYETIYQTIHHKRKAVSQENLFNMMLHGFYPRIHDKNLDSYKWYENYVFTYVERDVRALVNVKNLRTFEHFLLLIASRSGQLISYSDLSNTLGLSQPTIKEWISVLETSGLIYILPPYFNNLSKRLVKTPKLYFVDTGLLCHLLSIRTVEHLKTHPLLGNIFETFIVSECFKRFYNLGETPPLYFWRDQSKNEIDLLIHTGLHTIPVEVKLSQTYNPDFGKSIARWLSLADASGAGKGIITYCGKELINTHGLIRGIPWYML